MIQEELNFMTFINTCMHRERKDIKRSKMQYNVKINIIRNDSN